MIPKTKQLIHYRKRFKNSNPNSADVSVRSWLFNRRKKGRSVLISLSVKWENGNSYCGLNNLSKPDLVARPVIPALRRQRQEDLNFNEKHNETLSQKQKINDTAYTMKHKTLRHVFK
jgi:hypothetical protein